MRVWGLEAPYGNGLEAHWTHWLEASVTGNLQKWCLSVAFQQQHAIPGPIGKNRHAFFQTHSVCDVPGN